MCISILFKDRVEWQQIYLNRKEGRRGRKWKKFRRGGQGCWLIVQSYSIQTWALEEARRRLEIEGILPDPSPSTGPAVAQFQSQIESRTPSIEEK